MRVPVTKAKAKIYTEKEIGVTFDDVAVPSAARSAITPDGRRISQWEEHRE